MLDLEPAWPAKGGLVLGICFANHKLAEGWVTWNLVLGI
jgi:hypothetical protein